MKMNTEFYDNYKKIGLNISYYRRLKNYTQETLAEAIDIDQTHLSKIERAAVGVSLDIIFKISKALEIEPYKLFQFKE